MRLPTHVANSCLAVLIRGSGFSSLDRLADAFNRHGASTYGLDLKYDHTGVKRWLRGGSCEQPQVVAEVLSKAWGVPIPATVIWPDLRNGAPPLPAHLQPFVAARTLEDLGVFLRSDMLTRRDLLASSIGVAAGSTFVDPLARWLGAEPVGLPPAKESGPSRIGMAAVEQIESATTHFMTTDAAAGGGLSREAAVGQLKYAVDLLDQATYDHATGDRLLAAIGKLSGEIGYMSHDAGMEGPAQQYLTYGLQAARESSDERASVVAVGILADMARQMRFLGRPDTGLRLVDLAFDQLSHDPDGSGSVRAMLWNLKARMLASIGTRPSEVHSAIDLSLDLLAQARDQDEPPWQRSVLIYIGEAELQRHATGAYLDLAAVHPEATRRLATMAEGAALAALANWEAGFIRERAYGFADLAQARFLQSEPDQACEDGEQAVELSARVIGSSRLTARLGDLLKASELYRDHQRVRDFRSRLEAAVAGGR